KTGRVAELLNGWREKGECHRIRQLREGGHGPIGNRKDALVRPRALRPILQVHKAERRVLGHTGEVETGNRQQVFDVLRFFGQQVILDQLHALTCSFCGRTRRRHHLEEHDALVLVGEERAGDAREHEHGDQYQTGIDAHEAQHTSRHVACRVAVKVAHAIELTVEYAEEALLVLGILVSRRPQKLDTQGRRQDQGHQYRQGDGGNYRDGKLSIDYPCRTGEEGHRYEHRGEDERDTDQRTGYLPHRLDGGFPRRKVLLV